MKGQWVVGQLVEWLLPVSEICGSNAVISKFYLPPTVLKNCIEKTKIKKKEAGKGQFLHMKQANCKSLSKLNHCIRNGETRY